MKSMQLAGFVSNLKEALGRARNGENPWLGRLAPYRDRLMGEVRRHPKLVAGIAAVAGTWVQLVETFCAQIDPLVSKYFPDLRLVATTTATGRLELFKVAKATAVPLGQLGAMDARVSAEITAAKWTAIELRLRPDQLLQRTLSLPAASRDFLDPIIEHRLERLTPWHPDRVLYGYRLLAEPEAGGTVDVALTATSKDMVAAPLEELGAAGLAPTAIGTQDQPLVEQLGIDLLRGTTKASRAGSRVMVSRIALVAFAVLGLAYLASSVWASSAAGEQQEASARLMKARRLLKAASMGAIGDREAAMLEAKQPGKAVVVLIDKLATAIPQDTYLKELAVTPDKVRIVGVSTNAPSLVGALEAAGLINVRFTSAVVREKDQKDSFEITADRTVPAAASP